MPPLQNNRPVPKSLKMIPKDNLVQWAQSWGRPSRTSTKHTQSRNRNATRTHTAPVCDSTPHFGTFSIHPGFSNLPPDALNTPNTVATADLDLGFENFGLTRRPPAALDLDFATADPRLNALPYDTTSPFYPFAFDNSPDPYSVNTLLMLPSDYPPALDFPGPASFVPPPPMLPADPVSACNLVAMPSIRVNDMCMDIPDTGFGAPHPAGSDLWSQFAEFSGGVDFQESFPYLPPSPSTSSTTTADSEMLLDWPAEPSLFPAILPAIPVSQPFYPRHRLSSSHQREECGPIRTSSQRKKHRSHGTASNTNRPVGRSRTWETSRSGAYEDFSSSPFLPTAGWDTWS